MTKKNDDWMERFFVFELTTFCIAASFLYFGYRLDQVLFSIIGCSFIGFGMLLALLQRRGGKRHEKTAS